MSTFLVCETMQNLASSGPILGTILPPTSQSVTFTHGCDGNDEDSSRTSSSSSDATSTTRGRRRFRRFKPQYCSEMRLMNQQGFLNRSFNLVGVTIMNCSEVEANGSSAKSMIAALPNSSYDDDSSSISSLSHSFGNVSDYDDEDDSSDDESVVRILPYNPVTGIFERGTCTSVLHCSPGDKYTSL